MGLGGGGGLCSVPLLSWRLLLGCGTAVTHSSWRRAPFLSPQLEIRFPPWLLPSCQLINANRSDVCSFLPTEWVFNASFHSGSDWHSSLAIAWDHNGTGRMQWLRAWMAQAACSDLGPEWHRPHAVTWGLNGTGRMQWLRAWMAQAACNDLGPEWHRPHAVT